MPDVRVVDLDVIKRYSLAVRREWAPADEVLAVLDATRRQVVAALDGDGPGANEGPGADEGGAPARPRGARRRRSG